MKWKNKGHEYDQMFERIESKAGFYLFGAGDYGHQFCKIFDGKLNILGFIDNNEKKQGTLIGGYTCYSFAEAEKNAREQNAGIIITMSQIARITPVKQLQDADWKQQEDFFLIEEFISVYQAYKYDKVYFSTISFLPSTACNLNCKNCLNFNPFAKHFYVRDWDDLVADVDLFFQCVDHIMLFHVSGGEPFLYKNTARLIKYIDETYGDRIDTLRTVTNGTVVPSDETLKLLSTCNFEITVDDYRDAVPELAAKFDELLVKLDAYGIRYWTNKADSWIDLAPDTTDYSNRPKEWLIHHRDRCNQSWQELRDGKLYSCNYAAYATVAGVAGEQDLEEVYSLKGFTPDRKKELIEFRLGYTTKGYSNFCMKCKGFTPENDVAVKPAEQVERRG